jgi:hypothetical protein
MSSIAQHICDGLVAQAKREITSARLEAAQRPVGEIRLDIDFYSPSDRDKPMDDYDFVAQGRHYKGTGSRWCVVKVRWTGSEWRRFRKLTGPMKMVDALHRCSEECARTGLERA